MIKANALWHISPRASEIIGQDLTDTNENLLLIESLYSLVSLGTERVVSRGLVPQAVWTQMRVPGMEGSFSLPCKYGYSLAGRVLKGPARYLGRMVHVMHPHQDVVYAEASSVFLIPDEVPPQRAVLAGNFETAVNAVWDSEISVGDTVVIAGFGLIGALIAMLVSDIPGVTVKVHETNEKRCRVAMKMGFKPALNAGDAAASFDVAFNTTADSEGLQFCIDNTGFEGQVTEVSYYGAERVSVLLGETFHTARKKIVMSQVSHIPGKKMGRWDQQRRKNLVFDLLRDNRYDSLVENIVPFWDAPGLFNNIRNGSIDEISVILRYS
jgi:threonine dehydrogenase-like Zn-dependent dehydrogenase